MTKQSLLFLMYGFVLLIAVILLISRVVNILAYISYLSHQVAFSFFKDASLSKKFEMNSIKKSTEGGQNHVH